MLNQSNTWKCTRVGSEWQKGGTASEWHGFCLSKVKHTTVCFTHVHRHNHLLPPFGPHKSSKIVIVKIEQKIHPQMWVSHVSETPLTRFNISGRHCRWHPEVISFIPDSSWTITNRCPASWSWKVSSSLRNTNKRRPLRPGRWDLSAFPPSPSCRSDGGKASPLRSRRFSRSVSEPGEISARRICCRDLQKLIAHDRSHGSHMWEREGVSGGVDFSRFVFNGGRWCSNWPVGQLASLTSWVRLDVLVESNLLLITPSWLWWILLSTVITVFLLNQSSHLQQPLWFNLLEAENRL